MKTLLTYLGAAIAVLCLGKKVLKEIQGPEIGKHRRDALLHTRNLSSTRRGWGYQKGNR